jgi:hypothetical protein
MERGFTRIGHVVQHIAPLHPQRGHDRENASSSSEVGLNVLAGLAPPTVLWATSSMRHLAVYRGQFVALGGTAGALFGARGEIV